MLLRKKRAARVMLVLVVHGRRAPTDTGALALR
jgi:hypothetical protein